MKYETCRPTGQVHADNPTIWVIRQEGHEFKSSLGNITRSIIYEKLYKEKKNRKTRIETWKAFKLRQSWKNLQNKDSVVRDL